MKNLSILLLLSVTVIQFGYSVHWKKQLNSLRENNIAVHNMMNQMESELSIYKTANQHLAQEVNMYRQIHSQQPVSTQAAPKEKASRNWIQYPVDNTSDGTKEILDQASQEWHQNEMLRVQRERNGLIQQQMNRDAVTDNWIRRNRIYP